MADTFYRTFSEKRLTAPGAARRARVERSRLALLMRHIHPPGALLEIGPGNGTLAALAVEAGWQYSGVEPSAILAERLRGQGLTILEAFTPPIPAADASCDVVYADQVFEHMSGIDAARALTAESMRVLRPGGVLFVVVPDYLKEQGFFWDIDYTHNFVTTERRMRQLFYDGGFEIERVVRAIGGATGIWRDLLAAGSLFTNIPGVDAVARRVRCEDLVFRVRKNLFETLAIVARKPRA